MTAFRVLVKLELLNRVHCARIHALVDHSRRVRLLLRGEGVCQSNLNRVIIIESNTHRYGIPHLIFPKNGFSFVLLTIGL